MRGFIYVLRDPITRDVRYVGYSRYPDFRYIQHLGDDSESHKSRWIRRLLAQGLKPHLQILEEVGTDWSDRERYWIATFKFLEEPLTNLNDGGSGGRHCDEVRARMSQSQRGRVHSEETRQKMSRAMTGLKHKPFARTEEHCRKISESRKRYFLCASAS